MAYMKDSTGKRLDSFPVAAHPAWTPFSLTNRATTRALLCAQDNAAVYDATSNKTFIAFLGADRALFVMYYDHASLTASESVRVANYPYSIEDDHGTPSMAITADGYLNVAFGAHDISPTTARSAAPRSLDGTWTVRATNTILQGTYHQLASSGNDIYALFRVYADGGTGGHKGTSSTLSAYPAHEFADLCKSTDGMATWTKVSTVVDTNAYSVPATYAAKDFYPFAFDEHNGRLHFSFNIAYGTGHDGIRGDVYHAAWDIAQARMETAAGTDQGSALDTKAKLDACKLVSQDWTNTIRQDFASNGDIGLAWQKKNASGQPETTVAVFNGTTWTVADTGVVTKHLFTSGSIRAAEGGGFEVYAPQSIPGATPVLHPRDEAIGYNGSGASIKILTYKNGAFTSLGFVRQQDIAGLGVGGVVIPRKSDSKLKALIVTASPEGGVLGGLSSSRLPMYGLTDGVYNPFLAFNNPKGTTEMRIAPYEILQFNTLANSGTWINMSLSAAFPYNVEKLIVRAVIQGSGVAGRWEVLFRYANLSRSFDAVLTGDGLDGSVSTNYASRMFEVPIGLDRQLQYKWSGNITRLQLHVIGFTV